MDYSYVDKMKADAINLLTAFAARGQSVINPREILAELRRIGYPIRFNGLMQILQNYIMLQPYLLKKEGNKKHWI